MIFATGFTAFALAMLIVLVIDRKNASPAVCKTVGVLVIWGTGGMIWSAAVALFKAMP